MSTNTRILFTLIVLANLANLVRGDERPNVLFLFADDQRPDTIAALGNSVIKTPNLDSLARRGFVFDNAYCMGSTSGAVCNPSRHQTLSGISLFRYRKLRTDHQGTLGDVFTKAGYVTYHQSKRGNTARRYHKGFTHSSYLNDGAVRRSGHHGRRAATDAIAFLKEKWERDKPLFMYIGFAGPHDPRVAAKEWMDLYRRDEIPLPKNYAPFHPLDNGEMFVRDEKLAPWPRTKEVVRRHLHDYYGCISSIDHHIGRIFQTLRDLGEFENTIVIFSADHGLAIGSHGLFGKQSVYEHSFGAPLIFAGPGIPKGRSQAFAYLFDIFPTAADMAGLKTPDDLDGKSLRKVIRGETDSVRDSVFLAYKDVQRAYRKGDWKVIRYPKVNATQLFNLKDDPDELVDLASKHPDRVRSLLKQLAAAQKEWDDPDPLSVDSPTPAKVDASFFDKAKQPKKRRSRNKKAQE